MIKNGAIIPLVALSIGVLGLLGVTIWEIVDALRGQQWKSAAFLASVLVMLLGFTLSFVLEWLARRRLRTYGGNDPDQ